MSHIHRWILGEPAGATSEGVCECGETRVLSNVFRDDQEKPGGWRDLRSAKRNRLQLGVPAKMDHDHGSLVF